MQMIKTSFKAITVTLMISSGACLAGPGSVEEGKTLFNNPGLGGSTSNKSCNSCHNDGTGLEMSLNNPKIEQQINRCIVGALQGKALELDSHDMYSLKKYLISLGQ